MIKLQQLHLKNFLSYRELDFDFSDKSLAILIGDNGAGKSTIPSAVAWALFGRTQKGLQGDEVVNWDAKKNCVVMLKLDINDLECEVIRYRKYEKLENPNDLHLHLGDKEIKGTPTEKQKVLTEALGSDFQTFINTTFFSQGKVKFIGEVTDTDRKALFKSILDLGRFDVAYARTNEYIVLLEAELAAIQNRETDLLTGIRLIEQEHNHILEMSNQFEATKEAQLTDYRHRMAELEGKIRDQDNSAGWLKEAELLEDATKEDIPALRTAVEARLSGIEVEKRIGEDIILSTEADLNCILEKGICPTCKRPFDNEEIIKEKEDLIKSLRAKMGKIKKLHMETAGESIMLRKKEREYHDNLRKLDVIKTELQQLDTSVGDLQTGIKHLRELEQGLISQENPYPGALEVVENKLDVERDKLEEVQKGIEQYKEEMKLLGEVKEIYSKRGVVSFIMENYFKFLSSKANYYLSMLDSDITININAQKKTKKGDLREEITIEIQKGGRKALYENLSDGERQRTNLVLLLSIFCLCRSINISNFDTLFLDEVLDLSLDADGKSFIVELLNDIKVNEGIPHILVISHSPEIKERFQEVLHVRNVDGNSIIE